MPLTSLTANFWANPVDFMDRYPVFPAASLPSVSLSKTGNWGLGRVQQAAGKCGFYRNDIRNLAVITPGVVPQAGNRAAVLTPLGQPTERIIRFLPYYSRTVTLYDMFNLGTCPIFFTGAINGCSVFVDGTSSKPKVYHVGVEGPVSGAFSPAGNYGLPSSVMSRLARFSNADGSEDFYATLVRHHNKGQLFRAQVNKTHYVNDGQTPKKSTQRSRDLAQWLANTDRLGFKAPPNKIEVAPYGCFWGRRVGMGWEFYLQENAFVSVMGKIQKGVGIVLRHTRVFPKPDVVLRAQPDYPRLINRMRLSSG